VNQSSAGDGDDNVIRDASGQILWRAPDGTSVSCLEKIKVLNENLIEIQEMCQEALEDAVVIGCDEAQIRAVLLELIKNLEEPFK
jgi:hypothetical protein